VRSGLETSINSKGKSCDKTGGGFVHDCKSPVTTKTFIEMFGGSCILASTAARLRLPAESYEIQRSLHEDVTKPKVFLRFKK